MQHNVYTVHFDYAFLVFDFWALRLYFFGAIFCWQVNYDVKGFRLHGEY